MTIHLAILDVDIPVRPHYHRNGLYSTQYRSIIAPAVHRLSQSPLHPDPIKLVVSSWDIMGGVYPPDHLLQSSTATTTVAGNVTTTNKHDNRSDGIASLLITGSASSAYQTTTNPWIPPLKAFIRRVYIHHPHIKLIGGCFGHQLIAAALLPDSTRVEACPLGREVGVHAVQLTPRFQRAFGAVLGGKRELRMQMMHGDWVVSLPSSGEGITETIGSTTAGDTPLKNVTTNNNNTHNERNIKPPWLNIGWTKQCPIQGLYLPNRVLTLQGHFEIDSGGMSLVAREFGPILGWSEEVARAHQEKIAWEGGWDDGNVVADVIALFLVGEHTMSPVSKL